MNVLVSRSHYLTFVASCLTKTTPLLYVYISMESFGTVTSKIFVECFSIYIYFVFIDFIKLNYYETGKLAKYFFFTLLGLGSTAVIVSDNAERF